MWLWGRTSGEMVAIGKGSMFIIGGLVVVCVLQYNSLSLHLSRLPSLPRLSAGTRLLQKPKYFLDALRVGEELG